MIVLVALRMLVGFHFFNEGLSKLRDPKPFSAGFLGNAKGPLASAFHDMVWDADGFFRLNRDDTVKFWDQYRQKVIRHYGFDEEQIRQADQVLASYQQQLAGTVGDYRDDIDQYVKGLRRIDRNRNEAARMEVESLYNQAKEIESDVKGKAGPVLAKIDRLWSSYEKDLNRLATAEQFDRGYVELGVPWNGRINSYWIDKVVPWFDLTIGCLLLLGLFTRIASLAGAAFLGSIVVSQWPGWVGAAPVYYQAIEMMALLVLAVFAAGRYLGLDFFLYGLRMRCCPPKQGA